MSQKNTKSPRARKPTRDAHSRIEAIRAVLHKECAFASRDQCAAYEMAMTGVLALVDKNEDALANAREWKATQRGAEGPDSSALAIVDLAREVERAVHTRSKRDRSTRYPVELEPFVMRAADADAADERYAHAAEDAATDLRARLVARFGEKIPSVSDLEKWLGLHTGDRARGRPSTDAAGRLTTAEIVTRIARAARIGGLNPETDAKTARDHVSTALRREK